MDRENGALEREIRMRKPWSETDKRKHFQRVKSMSQAGFERYMNAVLSKAYGKAEQHYEEALYIALSPKQADAVRAQVEKIRVDWDGIAPYDVDEENKL